MAFSLQRAVSDGTLTNLAIDIEFFEQEHINVFVNDIVMPQNGTSNVDGYSYVWSGPTSITISPAVATGLEVLVRRSTPFDLPFHDFRAGAVFKDQTMDENFLQILYITQENVEGLTATDFYTDLNFHGYRLRNVGTATAANDAVPLSQYQADALGAYQAKLDAEAAATAAAASQAAAAASASSASTSATSASASATSASGSATSASASASSADASKLAAQGYAASAATSSAEAIAAVASMSVSVGTYNDVRAFTSSSTRLDVGGRANYFDGGLGFFKVDTTDTTSTDNDGTTLVDVTGRRWKRQFTGPVKAVWFGVVGGDLTQDYSSKVQAAVTVGCTSYGGVDFPAGQIRIDNTITFPNTAFDLHGASGTGTEFVTGVANLTMLSFVGCSGPAKTVNRIGFGTTTPGSYNNIKGVVTGSNGLLFNYCWWRGLLTGLEWSGSFINLNFCTFEFNFVGINCLSGCVETEWVATTHYKNETDVKLLGDNTTFSSFGSNHIGTKTNCWDMTNCVGAQIYGVTVKNDGTAYTPDVIHFKGTSTGNYVDGVSTTDFGRYTVFFEGSSVAENKVVGLDVRRSSVVVGTRGVFSSTGPRNVVEGRVDGCEYGVFFDTAAGNVFRGRIKNCTTGTRLSAAADSVLAVDNSGNTADAVATSTTTLHLERFNGDTSGFDSIPYIFRHYGFRREVYTTAAPTLLTWRVGDLAVNRTVAVGSAKGWRCTVAGTPGTWVSEGVL